ncbi:MAG: DUF1566 domain-containing protein, partial [Candidatus Latescibacteria bacterium]|nr:DUF1566 domain-containing protein [Candidatus Latescibacterota bacterium]
MMRWQLRMFGYHWALLVVCVLCFGYAEGHVIHMQQTAVTDFNGDGNTNFPDFIAFAAAFGTGQASFDLDQNGEVDFPDFLVFAAAFGQPESGISDEGGTGNDAPLAARAFQHFADQLNIRWGDDFLYVESNAFPDHRMMVGITAWNQQVPLPQPYQADNAWQISLKPTVADAPIYASQTLFRGAIGLAVNGVPIFNPIKNDGRTDTNLAGELDEFGGHAGRADDYHYHIAPLFLNKVVGEALPIAYALDGYPMYGLNEPDGASVVGLDDLNGHVDANGHYHYHSTLEYPYVNGGFKGAIELANGEEVANQPRTRPVRPSGTGMQATITDFVKGVDDWYRMTYEANGGTQAIGYFLRADGDYDFQFVDANSNTTSQTYRSNGSVAVVPSGSGSTGNSEASQISPIGLPDTGQDGDYTGTFGEDSDYSIQALSYADNADGTVTDLVTNMMWQQGEGGEMTWKSATAYCADLSLAGKDDWRLPTSHELFGILNHGGVRPSINTVYFTATDAEYWWTSDTRADNATRIWAANTGGGIGPHPVDETRSAGGNKIFSVRCVRGDAVDEEGRFKKNADGTVTDRVTGLMWQQGETQAMTWEEALVYAEGLALGDHTDWRLPNIKELRSINNEKLAWPSVDLTVFPQAQSLDYWSSTTLANRSERAWFVDFRYGLVT